MTARKVKGVVLVAILLGGDLCCNAFYSGIDLF